MVILIEGLACIGALVVGILAVCLVCYLLEAMLDCGIKDWWK